MILETDDTQANESDVETSPRAAATDNRLRLLIERVERLEEEKKGIADDIRDVMPRPRRWATTARSCARSCA